MYVEKNLRDQEHVLKKYKYLETFVPALLCSRVWLR